VFTARYGLGLYYKAVCASPVKVNIATTVRSAHTVFMGFVFIWEQTATCATYSINWLVLITQMKSVYSAVDLSLTIKRTHFVLKGLNFQTSQNLFYIPQKWCLFANSYVIPFKLNVSYKSSGRNLHSQPSRIKVNTWNEYLVTINFRTR
jgi:hypothetical protein